MKKLIMALALTAVSSIALAQTPTTPASGSTVDKPPPHGGPAAGGKPPHMARMQDDLGLTDEQVKKMREIRDSGGTREEMNAVLTPEQRVKAAEVRKSHRAEFAERKSRMKEELGLSDEQVAKMEQIRQEGGSREEMRAVLTPEQQTRFDAMRSQYKGKGPKAAP